jgi:hypothetical protein
MWHFDYEQAGPRSGSNERGIYKFDHEPISDGEWHELFAGARAWYRYDQARMQFVSAHSEMTDEECREALAILASCGPLDTDWAVEVVIRSKGDRFEMWDRDLGDHSGVEFAGFSPEAFNHAYRELRQLVVQRDRELEDDA